MHKKQKQIDVIAYLSTEGNMYSAPGKEKKQLRYIREYAKAHDIRIIKVMNRDILDKENIIKHFKLMANMIKNGMAEGVIVANIDAISISVADAYYKIGLIVQAGGVFISVDEGNLALGKETAYGKKE